MIPRKKAREKSTEVILGEKVRKKVREKIFVLQENPVRCAKRINQLSDRLRKDVSVGLSLMIAIAERAGYI